MIESDYETGWREGYEAASGQAQLQLEEKQRRINTLVLALNASHQHLYFKEGCTTCEVLSALH